MTLEAWLQEALESYPAGVQRRLGGEYRTHLEDSVAAGESGDPVQVLGDPRSVAQTLKRSYLTRSEWTFWFGTGKVPGSTHVLSGLLVLGAVAALASAPPPYALILVVLTLIVLLAVYRRLEGKPPGDRFFLFSSLGLLLQGLNRLVALGLTWTPTAFNVRFGVIELLAVLVTGCNSGMQDSGA